MALLHKQRHEELPIPMSSRRRQSYHLIQCIVNNSNVSCLFYFPKGLVANIDYDDFKGKLGVGRIHSGSLRKGQTVGLGRPDGPVKTGKVSELFVFDNLGRTVRGLGL